MIVKKLRDKNNWSQDQLATMCGLSIRTIQRVESGQSASLETIKSLASVFEINISTLTEEITVIDKKLEKWKNQPWWFKVSFLGIRSRRVQIGFEKGLLVLGVASLFVETVSQAAPILLLGAYFTCLAIRHGDNNQLWDM